MGYNLTHGLEKWMIDYSVMKFEVVQKKNKIEPYMLNWTVTEILISSFKVQLELGKDRELSNLDFLSMKFIKSQVFFGSRQSENIYILPEEEQEEFVIDPDYSFKDTGNAELPSQIRIEIDRNFKFSVQIPP